MTQTGKLYTFFTDVHEGGPCPSKVEWDFGPRSFYLGDNVDVRWWSPKRSILSAYERLYYFKRMFGDRFVRGNHELNMITAPDWIKTNGILITHGDYLFWGKEMADSYRKKERSHNSLARRVSSFFSCTLSHWFQLPVSKKFLQRCAKVARLNGCHTVVCGHWHPKKVRTFISSDGLRVVILPRGRTDLYL